MTTLYLVIPCYNEELVIKDTTDKLMDFLSTQIEDGILSADSRVCYVDDGSTDKTWNLIRDEYARCQYITGIKLLGNRGHQNALLAGMMWSRNKCDAVVTIDADLQHDITVIPEFVRLYEQGYAIVYGVRKNRQGEKKFKRWTGDGFYAIMRFLGMNIIKNHADYRLVSSRVMEALEEYQESNLFLRGLIPNLGFPGVQVEYEEKQRMAGESKYTVRKMFDLALNGVTSSMKPLRLIGCMGG